MNSSLLLLQVLACACRLYIFQAWKHVYVSLPWNPEHTSIHIEPVMAWPARGTHQPWTEVQTSL